VFLSFLPSLQIYSLYAKTYVNVSATLAKAISSDLAIRKALEIMKKKHSSEYSLPDLLMLPLSRLDRYVLLLKQFLEGNSFTPSGDASGDRGEKAADRMSVEQALKGMSALALGVEEQLSLEKNVNEVKRISKMLINYPGSLCEPGRYP
jgi:hypothetical protein